MKKFIYSAIAAIGLLLAPACSDENEVLNSSGNEALVSFNVNLADGIQTKTISDGKTVNKVYVRVYEKTAETGIGHYLNALDQTVNISEGGPADVTIRLVKGKTYNILFWAQYDTDSPYTIDNTEGTITVSYASANCNDENRDAFYFVKKDYVVSDQTTSVTLKRPFAQLNFLVDKDEIDAAKAMGLDFGSAKTSIKITNAAAETFDPFASTVSNKVADATEFALVKVPFGNKVNNLSEADNTTITGVTGDYYYLATTYVLADGQADKVTLIVNDISENYTTEYMNIPFKQNYRTNIYGKLLTEEGTFNVSVDNEFSGNTDKTPGELQTQP